MLLEKESLVEINRTPAAIEELTGKRPSLPTVNRWIYRGCRGAVLESALVGGKRVTSREAIARFFAALNSGDDVSRRHAAAQACEVEISGDDDPDRELDALGL